MTTRHDKLKAAREALECIAKSPAACLDLCIKYSLEPVTHGGEDYMRRAAVWALALLEDSEPEQAGDDDGAQKNDTDNLRRLARESHDLVCGLNQPRGTVGARSWTMSIPARQDDPDILITALCHAAKDAADELDQLRQQRDELKGVTAAFIEQLWRAEKQRDEAVRHVRELMSHIGESHSTIADWLATIDAQAAKRHGGAE